jgi:hypothetical protein
MPEPEKLGLRPTGSTEALQSMHKLFLEALRHREQEIIRYLAILGPALGGFIWLLHSGSGNVGLFTVGTMGVLLLLCLGALYSLALGYNYRYITLELAKLEAVLGIRDAVLVGWPRTKNDFLNRYKTYWSIPWCTPPEIIKIFWIAFVLGIAGVTVTAWKYKPSALVLWLVIFTGVVCLLMGLLAPIWFGWKLRKKCQQEPESWNSPPL